VHGVVGRANWTIIVDFVTVAARQSADELRVADYSHLFACWEGISGKELPNLLLESLPTHPNLVLILVGVGELKQNWHSSLNKLIMSAFRPELAQD